MPEQDYISRVYSALKDNLQGFDKDENTFRSEMQKPEYVTKVYSALKDNLQGFDKTDQEFYSQVGVSKKKALSEPNFNTTPPLSQDGGEPLKNPSPLKSNLQGQLPSETRPDFPTELEISHPNDFKVKTQEGIADFIKPERPKSLGKDFLEQQKNFTDEVNKKFRAQTGHNPEISEEESYMDELKIKFATGINGVASSMLRSPGFIYDIAAAPQNALVKAMGKPELQVTGENKVLDKSAEYYENLTKEASAHVDEKYDKDIIDYLADGNVEKAVKLMGDKTAEMLPLLAGFALTHKITTGNQQLFGVSGIGMGGSIKHDIDEQHPDMGEGEKTALAYSKALLMGLTYTAPVKQIGGMVEGMLAKGATKEEAVKFGSQALEEIWQTALKKAKVITPSLKSGLNFGAMTVAQNMVDKASGLDPDKEIFDGFGDNFILGVGLVAPFDAAAGIHRLTTDAKSKKAITELDAKKTSLETDLQNPAMPDAAKEAISNEIKAVTEKINDHIENHDEKFQGLPQEKQVDVKDLSKKSDDIEDALKVEGLSEESKTALEGTQKGINKEIDKIYKEKSKEELPVEPETINKELEKPVENQPEPEKIKSEELTPKETEVTNGKENIAGVSGEIGNGEELIQEEPIETSSSKKGEASGIPQSQEEVIKSEEDKVKQSQALKMSQSEFVDKKIGTAEEYQESREKAVSSAKNKMKYFANKIREVIAVKGLEEGDFGKQIKDYLDGEDWKDKVDVRTVKSLINRATKVKTQREVDNFIKYASDVINDAKYDERMDEVRVLQKAANKVKHISFDKTVKYFTDINPEKIPDKLMPEYIKALDELTSRTPSYKSVSEMFYDIQQLKGNKEREYDNVRTFEKAQETWDNISENNVESVEDYRSLFKDINSLKNRLELLVDNEDISKQEYDDLIEHIGKKQYDVEKKYASQIEIIKNDLANDIKDKPVDASKLPEEEQDLVQRLNNLTREDLKELSPEKLFVLNDLIENINNGEAIDIHRFVDVLSSAEAKYQAKQIIEQANKAESFDSSTSEGIRKQAQHEAAFWEGLLGLGKNVPGAYHKFIVSPFEKATASYHNAIYEGQKFYSKLIKENKIDNQSKFKIGMVVNYLQEYMGQFNPKFKGTQDIGNRDWVKEILENKNETDKYDQSSPSQWQTIKQILGSNDKTELQNIEEAYTSLPKKDGKVSPEEVYNSFIAKDGEFLDAKEQKFVEELFDYKEENLKDKQRISNEIGGQPFFEEPFHMMRIRKGAAAEVTPQSFEASSGNVRINSGTGMNRTNQRVGALDFNIDKMFLKGLEQTARDYYYTDFLKTFNRTLSAAKSEIKTDNQNIIDIAKGTVKEALNYEFNREQKGFIEKGLQKALGAQAALALLNPIRTFAKELPASFLSYPLRARTLEGYRELMRFDNTTTNLIKFTDSPLRLRDNINKALETDIGELKKESKNQKAITWLSGLPERMMVKTVWQPTFETAFKDLTGKEFDREAFKTSAYKTKYNRQIKEAGSVADGQYEKIVGPTTKGTSTREVNIFGAKQPLDTPAGQLLWFFNRYPYRELHEFINGFKEIGERFNEGEGVSSLTSLAKPTGIVLNTLIYGYMTSITAGISMQLLGNEDEKAYGKGIIKNLSTWDGFLEDLEGNLTALGVVGRYGLVGRALLQTGISIAYNNTEEKELKDRLKQFLKSSVFLDVTPIPDKPYGKTVSEKVAYSFASEIPAMALGVRMAVDAIGGGKEVKRLFNDYHEKGFDYLSKDDQSKVRLLDVALKSTEIAANIKGTSLPNYKDIERFVRSLKNEKNDKKTVHHQAIK